MAGNQRDPDGRTHRYRARRFVEDDVLTLARQRASHIFDLFEHVCVLFSGGKDSTAALHITLEEAERRGRLPLRAIFYDEEAIPFETEAYVRRVAQDERIALEWLCVPFECRNACSVTEPYWYPWAPEAEPLWCRPLPPEAITTLKGFRSEPPAKRIGFPEATPLLFTPGQGSIGIVMGIRAAESMTRQRAVSYKVVDNYMNHCTTWRRQGLVATKVYPIYDWTTADVWTAPAQFGWDYNRAYDALEMLGVGHDQQRCSPAFGEQPLGGLWQYAEAFPDVWSKMTERVAGVGAAYRYARTELYGYGKVAPPPPGMSWEDYIANMIRRHPDDIQVHVARRVKTLLHGHYARTADRPAPRVKHPDSGVSWSMLYMIAMRGDLKERTQLNPPKYDTPEDEAKARARYAADMATVTED